MPASYLHGAIAKDAALSLPDQHPPLPGALLAGAEGPDPLFLSPINSRALRLASLIHTQKTGDFLLSLLQSCAGDPLTRAYACGFLSHYAADTTLHPFVYAHAFRANGRYSSRAHIAFEHRLDTHYARAHGTTAPPIAMQALAALDQNALGAISHALGKAVAAVFPECALSDAYIRRSFTRAAFLSRALHPLHRLPSRLRSDMRAPWASPWKPDVLRTESPDDLIHQAVLLSQALMHAGHETMLGHYPPDAMRALLHDLSYHSGLPWRDTQPARSLTVRRA